MFFFVVGWKSVCPSDDQIIFLFYLSQVVPILAILNPSIVTMKFKVTVLK